MIAGTIVVEGMSIQFALVEGLVEYTVTDGLTGVTARKAVTPGEWAANLAIMFGGDSPELAHLEQELYEIAEEAQPDAASLVGAEEADAEATEMRSVRSVRMIP